MRPHSPEASEHFVPLLGHCHHQIHKAMDRRLRQYDVTPMQCRVLLYLYKTPEEINQKTLEQYLMVKPSTVNGIVARLEEKGLLSRQSSRTDGRCRILRLTEQGRSFHDVFHSVVWQITEQIERGFTPQELETFKSFLLRVEENLAEQTEEERL